MASTAVSHAADLVLARPRGQWRTLTLMTGVVLLLHLVGFALLFFVVAPHHFHLGTAAPLPWAPR